MRVLPTSILICVVGDSRMLSRNEFAFFFHALGDLQDYLLDAKHAWIYYVLNTTLELGWFHVT